MIRHWHRLARPAALLSALAAPLSTMPADATPIVATPPSTTAAATAVPDYAPTPLPMSGGAGYEEKVKKYFTFEETDKDVFRSTSLSALGQGSAKAAFGGLIFAQALAAAENTVDTELKPHAIHSFFILNVDTRIPCEYRVRRIRDGRSFATRSVEAVQNGQVAFSMQCSFHKVEQDACVHQHAFPEGVPPPETCLPNKPLADKLLSEIRSGARQETRKGVLGLLKWFSSVDTKESLFEIRPAFPDASFGLTQSRDQMYWVRARDTLTSYCERLHRYMLAFNSDSTLAGTVIRPHLFNDFTMSMMFSLDHVVHLHRHNVRADQWLLWENTTTYSGGGRGYTTARLWTRDGQLVLSATQECLIRTKGEPSRL